MTGRRRLVRTICTLVAIALLCVLASIVIWRTTGLLNRRAYAELFNPQSDDQYDYVPATAFVRDVSVSGWVTRRQRPGSITVNGAPARWWESDHVPLGAPGSSRSWEFAVRLDLRPDSRIVVVVASGKGSAQQFVFHPDKMKTISRLRSLAESSPQDVWSHHRLASALGTAGELEQAALVLEKAIQTEPADAGLRLNLVRVLASQGQSEEAISEARKAVRLTPESASPHFELGRLLLKGGDSEQAVSEFREAVRLAPERSAPRLQLGHALYEQGEVDRAIRHFRTAVAMDPGDVDARDWLARALLRKGEVEQAVTEFESCISMSPDDGRLQNNLAAALYKAGRHSDAWHHVQIARDLGYKCDAELVDALEREVGASLE